MVAVYVHHRRQRFACRLVSYKKQIQDAPPLVGAGLPAIVRLLTTRSARQVGGVLLGSGGCAVNFSWPTTNGSYTCVHSCDVVCYFSPVAEVAGREATFGWLLHFWSPICAQTFTLSHTSMGKKCPTMRGAGQAASNMLWLSSRGYGKVIPPTTLKG
jgi:hypothetical protein